MTTPSFKNFGFAPGVQGFPKGLVTDSLWATYSLGNTPVGETFEKALEEFIDSLPTALDICLSGKDSLLLAHYAQLSGRTINLWWLDIANDPNRAVVTGWAKDLLCELNIVPISMKESIDFAIANAPVVRVNKPTYLLVPYLFKEMSEYVLIGEGDPEKAPETFSNFVLTPGKLVVNAAEFTYDESIKAAGLEGCGAALSATPALVRTSQALTVKNEKGGLTMAPKYRELLKDFAFVEKTDNWAGDRAALNLEIRNAVRAAHPGILSNVTSRVTFSQR